MAEFQGESYRYAGTVQVGELSAVVADSTIYADGFTLPAGANAVPLGIVQKGVVPKGGPSDTYSAGVIDGISGTAWPANSLPASPKGQARSVRRFGRSGFIAAAPINRGDALVIADASGRLESVTTLAPSAGTLVNVIGFADTAVAAAGETGFVWLAPFQYKA
ncbi:MAG TPA: hypothetical protein VFC10_07425 [Terriglobia bacterium]|jgi:hypothetical protein|nr:hypothetical protein [Terracidiphilus sp.]HZT69564.1 hypothetical protein [Terriglobia bacterium]